MTPIKLPKIGWIGMPRCRNRLWLGRWYKSNGAEIQTGEIVAVVNTPNGNINVKAPASGFLFWMKRDHHKVHLLDVLGIIIDKL
jgi:pyruvate/2-oxoglutarate dehydrogenase complex dihydrolipoamide acyltransferase (E2) component